MTRDVEVETPFLREQLFANLDAALDYCKFAQPKELYISNVQISDGRFTWLLQFNGSEGNE